MPKIGGSFPAGLPAIMTVLVAWHLAAGSGAVLRVLDGGLQAFLLGGKRQTAAG